METHTSYYCGNSSTRNGTCMDSPPPPYVGGGDLSFEGVKFSVMGSGRRVVPCPHCRRDLDTFDTLLLHSEGLKKGSVRNEVIFVVNILESYNATGNYEPVDARPPLYQIPNSSHFGAEYCRHCNQADSLTNKPLSCASTRAESSSHDSFSDAEQFSMSLDENTPPTYKCFSNRHHSEQGIQEEQLSRDHQNGHHSHSSPEQHINTSQRRHDYIANSNTKRRRRSSSPKNIINQKPHSPMTYLSPQSRTEYILTENPVNNNAAYPGEVSNPSKITRHDNKLKSTTTLPYQTSYKCPVVAPQQNEIFLAEDDKKLKDKMGRQIRDALNKKTPTKVPYNDNQWSQDLEALKNDLFTDPKTKDMINRLVERSIQSWISSYNEKVNIDSLKESDNRVLGRKGDIPPPLKIDTCDDVELNVVCSQESLAERPPDYPEKKNGQNEDEFISDKEEFQGSTYIPHGDKSYSPTERNVGMRSRSSTIQTPANDSGFFSPSPKIMLNLSPFDHEQSETNSFRHSSDDTSSNVGSPDVSFTGEKWKDSRHTYTNDDAHSNRGYASAETANDQNNNNNNNSNSNNNNNNNLDYDDDSANVTSSCKSDTENCDFHRNMTCETSSETATVCSTNSAYINDEEENNDFDYDIINPDMSPGGGFGPSISHEPWDDFRRSISVDCPNGTGTESPCPDEELSNHEQFRRESSGDDSQSTTTSLKKDFTSFEKIENTPVIYQDITEDFSPPRHSYVTDSSPDSPEWDSKLSEQVNISEWGADNLSSKDTTKPVEKRESREPNDSDGTIVAKRLTFETCSSPSVADGTNTETSSRVEDLQKEPRTDDDETNLTDVSTCEKVATEQNVDSSSEAKRNNQPAPVQQEEKTTRQKREASVESTQQKKQAKRVKINEKRSTDFSYKVVNSKERFPLKEPDQESLTTCKARAILQSLETSNKTIGTYTPFELENVRTKNSSQNLLFTGGPFQADQNFRSWLADIVCNKNGQYIVTDWSNCCVQMFSTSGLPGDRVTFTSGPWGLALMNDNIVACTVPHAKQISLLSHGSRLIVVGLVSTVRRYWGIAVAKNQNLVCSCTQGIDLLNSAGKVLRTIQYNEVELEFFVFPQYLTVGDNGVIYVSDSCGTYLIGLPEDGDYSFSFKPLGGIKLRTPRAIEYGRDGFVYIADTDTDKIYRLTEDGVLDSELFNATDNVKGPLAITIRDRKMVVTQKDSSILILPI